LEEFVKANREDFDVRQPDPSLWLRINPASEKPKANRQIRWLRYAVAAAVIFAFVSAGIYFITGTNPSPEKLYGELYREIMEAEAYYTGIVDQKYNELTPWLSSSPELKEELDYDLDELDQIYLDLKSDLQDNVGNPEVIDAMIQQYRMKVEILEQLLNQLKEKEKQDYEDKDEISL